MSLRLEMLQVARLSPKLLGDSASLVIQFLHGQLNADGGFCDRGGQSDLYYTVFGIESLLALRAEVPVARLADYLKTFKDPGALDFVHACCLARCWANLPTEYRGEMPREPLAKRIEAFRSADGGYDTQPAGERATLYGCFLATAAYADLGLPMPRASDVLQSILPLRTADGGYANHQDLPVGLTPSTAAAVTLLHHLQQPIDPALGEWLLARSHPEGGFFATPLAPMPDLLSTATALHALAAMHADVDPIKEATLDYVDSLWTNRGSFHGNWTEETLDTEYTYYGLLALGHLSL